MNGQRPWSEQRAAAEPAGPGGGSTEEPGSGSTAEPGSAVAAGPGRAASGGPASSVRVRPFGEAALLVELDPASLRPSTLGRLLAVALSRDGPAVADPAVARPRSVRALEGVEDVVVGEESVVVLVDPFRCDVGALEETLREWASLDRALRSGVSEGQSLPGGRWDAGEAGDPLTVTPVPTRYGGEDLRSVADLVGLSVEEVVARHVAPVYEVTMVGFAPGFCYLSGLDPVLALPRLDTPRPRVPAGAVGIAGLRSCIYPMATPGGWRLLGRTSMTLWDPARNPPARFRPGDRLRFVVDPT